MFSNLYYQAGSPRTRSTPSSPSTLPRNPDYKMRSPSDQSPGHSSVHGVGKGDPSHQGRNLRNDLLHAADNVTNAMSSLVNELTSGKYTGQFVRPGGGELKKGIIRLYVLCNQFYTVRYT